MYHRHKRIRRLTILFLGFCALCALGAQIYRIGLRRSRAMTQAMRQQAVVSYTGGNYENAVVQFAEYFAKSHAQETDAPALYAYAQSRLHVPEPRMQQIYDAIQLFEHYLACRDDNPQRRQAARQQLLHLYVQAHYSDEAVKLANRMLQIHPADADALKAEVQALDEKKDEQGALAACRQLNRVAPSNFWGQRVTVYLMQQTGASNRALIDYAQSLQKAHRNQPMFEMVLAVTYELVKDAPNQRKWLAAAAAHTPTDPALVADLADRLDRCDLFADADALLRRADQRNPGPALDNLLVRRLWEDGDTDAVLDRTAHAGPHAPASDSPLLVFRDLALQQAGRSAEAQSLARALAARSDPVSRTWAPVLSARLITPPPAPLHMANLLRDAISGDPTNGILHELLGRTYDAMDETEPALDELKQAVALEPGWAAPHLLGASIFGRTGRFNYALDSTIAAQKRRPDSKQTQIAHAIALYHFSVAYHRPGLYASALREIQRLQASGHDPALLPAEVDLLNGVGRRQDAIDAARKALHRTPALPADAMLQLAQISRYDQLGLDQQIRGSAQKAHGLTVAIAQADARALHRAGKDQQGLSLLLDAARANADAKPWRLAIAQYRERIGDLNALRDFELLGNACPADLHVQRAILASSSRTRDREFWRQSIERLKALTGPEGIEWRTQRGQYLLAGDWTDTDRDEAIKLLKQVVAASTALPEPHRLLARALEKSHDVPGATSEYQAAYTLRPTDPLYAAALVDFLIKHDHPTDAATVLDTFCRSATLTDSTRHWAAREYAQTGHVDRAITLLKAANPGANRDALLVELEGKHPAVNPAAAN